MRFLYQRRRFIAALIGIALIGIGYLLIQEQAGTNAKVATRLRGVAARLRADDQQLIYGCQRLNVVLVVVNRVSYADFTLLSGLNGPRAHKFPIYQRAVKAQSWVPKPNCGKAVALHGAHYKLPTPVPFVKRSPPPSALSFP